jgi:hypothetical protein
MTTQELLTELDKLTDKDLLAVRDKVAFVLSMRKRNMPTITTELLWKELEKSFLARFKTTLIPFRVMSTKMPKVYNKLCEVQKTLDAMTEIIVPGATQTQQIKMYWLFVTAVLDYLAENARNNTVFNVSIVLDYVSVFPTILNNSFPDYSKEMLRNLVFGEH